MPLLKEWKEFNRDGETFRSYISRSDNASAPLPAVIVIQEIWGTDKHIQEVTDRFASAGYLAIAPDLFAENGVRPEALTDERIGQLKEFLNTLPQGAWHNRDQLEAALGRLEEGSREGVRATFNAIFGGMPVKIPDFLRALKASYGFLQDYEWTRGAGIASVGFCLGGALSAQLAAMAPGLAGAVVFYGNLPDEKMLQSIQCPVQGFFGATDERITSQVAGFDEAMRNAGKTFTYKVYEGAGHAFFNDTRTSYNPDAAKDSWEKTLAFLNRVLGQ